MFIKKWSLLFDLKSCFFLLVLQSTDTCIHISCTETKSNIKVSGIIWKMDDFSFIYEHPLFTLFTILIYYSVLKKIKNLYHSNMASPLWKGRLYSTGFHQIIPAFLKKKTYGSRGFSGSKAVSSSKLGSLGAGGGLCCSHLNIGMYIHIQVAQTMENFYCLSPLFREISVVLQSMLKLEIDCERGAK